MKNNTLIAMNNTLGFTNNNIKNINIDKTNAVAIDYDAKCIIAIAIYIAGAAIIIGTILFSGGTMTAAAAWLFFLAVDTYGISFALFPSECW